MRRVPNLFLTAMRLWSLHPQYLDPKGLVALWREALLARAVLRGETRGYTRHPQLNRFRTHAQPQAAMDVYLAAVHAEATARGYRFDVSKFDPTAHVQTMTVTNAQLAFEWQHLRRKLEVRAPDLLSRWPDDLQPLTHPLLDVVPGPLETWERP